jgi:hypothetical protein
MLRPQPAIYVAVARLLVRIGSQETIDWSAEEARAPRYIETNPGTHECALTRSPTGRRGLTSTAVHAGLE